MRPTTFSAERSRKRSVTAAAAGGAGSGKMAAVVMAGGRILLKVGLGAGLVAATLPTFISTKLGTRTLVSTINYMTPGVVEVDEIQLGWTQPLLLKGVRLRTNTGPDQRLLLSVPRISSAGSLMQLATGHSPVVAVTEPVIDATLDDDGSDFRIVRFLEGSGVLKKDASAAPRFVQSTTAPDPQPSSDLAAPKHAAAKLEAEGPSSHAPSSRDASPLSHPTSQIQFHADLRAYTAQVYVEGGRLMVPNEFRQLLGSSIHVSAVMGRHQLEDSKDELDLDISWMDSGEGGPTASGQPTVMELRSDTIAASVVGWKEGQGFLLHQPATASLELTPSLLRFGLSQANPLLAGVVDLREGGRVAASFSPSDGWLPYKQAAVRVEPMKLTLVTDSILGQLMDFIGQRGRLAVAEGLDRRVAMGARLLDLFGRSVSKSPHASATAEDNHDTRAVQVWTSGMEWDISKSGMLATHRLDMLIGPPNSGLHVALWGSCDRSTDKINMTLGLPVSTLRKVGLKNLPADFMLTLDIRGTVSKPKVNWVSASKKIAALAALEVKTSGGDTKGWLDAVLQSATVIANQESLEETVTRIMAESISVPPLRQPLPWTQ